MNENPKISVIMSVYKEPVEWLHQSIDSILCQTFKDFEFIIISDNPSYSEGNALLKDYADKDKRIIVVFNENNIGLTKSLNKGLAIAKGEYIARMDADDVSLPERFECQIGYMETHSGCSICGANFKYIGERDWEVKYKENLTKNNLFLESPFAHPTVMIRTSFLGEAKYDENFRVSQDFELWSRLSASDFYYHNIQTPLLYYRCSKNQIMSKSGGEQEKNSRIIRRQLLNNYAHSQRIDLRMPEEITYDFKRFMLQSLKICDAAEKEYLLFCLFVSINASSLSKIFNMLKDGDLKILKFKSVLRIIKYSALNMDAAKF